MLRTKQVRPQLLVTVLDWGMGHATRTWPLIEHAIEKGWHVHVASKGTALAWLQSRAEGQTHLSFHTKLGQEIKYAKRGNFWRIARQMPAFVANVNTERKWTKRMVETYNLQAILSDNCYGCATDGIPSILMTHQLQIPTPKWLEGFARKMVKRWASAFDEVWVPDLEPGCGSLSGFLAEAQVHPRTKYVGVLSRLAKHKQENLPQKWAKVGMVSGVEPHRSLMEHALRSWMKKTKDPCLLISGQPGGGTNTDGNITTWCDPTDEDLAFALQSAGTLVCRSGYSSQLDLVALKTTAILIPTPGQPEQVFLGNLWSERFGFVCISQRQLERGHLPEVATGNPPAIEANSKAFQQLASWLHEAASQPA